MLNRHRKSCDGSEESAQGFFSCSLCRFINRRHPYHLFLLSLFPHHLKTGSTHWDVISESQELGIPPYIYDLFKNIIIPAFKEKNTESLSFKEVGLTRQDIIEKHYEIVGRHLPDWSLRQQIIPMLEVCGLIRQETDGTDKRRVLIYPTTLLTISPEKEGNSEWHGGVTDEGL
ncbi:MAG: hypothetical protein N2234_10250 [Planctomycetota bacterium]|nr:hypothetical protein [Planctomycetota bacterium]